jgi:methylmalonyl-CoA mutase
VIDDAPEARAALRGGSQRQRNPLTPAIEASRARATVGEISDAVEKIFTRHRAQIRAGLRDSLRN